MFLPKGGVQFGPCHCWFLHIQSYFWGRSIQKLWLCIVRPISRLWTWRFSNLGIVEECDVLIMCLTSDPTLWRCALSDFLSIPSLSAWTVGNIIAGYCARDLLSGMLGCKSYMNVPGLAVRSCAGSVIRGDGDTICWHLWLVFVELKLSGKQFGGLESHFSTDWKQHNTPSQSLNCQTDPTGLKAFAQAGSWHASLFPPSFFKN